MGGIGGMRRVQKGGRAKAVIFNVVDAHPDSSVQRCQGIFLLYTLAPARPASVAELVDARDSKSRSAKSVGSIPTRGTTPQ